jgi:ADP-heptose:LPS heptosyltransferase
MSHAGIFILDPYGIGNVVMSIPFLRAACASGREVTVLLASPLQHELLIQEGLKMRAIYRSAYPGWRGLARLANELRGKIGTVAGLPQVPATTVFCFAAALGASVSAGESFPLTRPLLTHAVRKTWTRPILDAQQELAHRLGLCVPLEAPCITITEEERRWAKDTLETAGVTGAAPLVGFHCSAAEPSKRWPSERFGQLAQLLVRKWPRLAVVSVGGEVDREDAACACRAAGGVRWLETSGRLGVRQSIALLQRCNLIISGDTGIMHLGAAVGVCTLGIFGPTSALRLAPSYNGGAAVTPHLKCHPCYRDRYRPCARCMEGISPERVAEAAFSMLASNG